MIQPSQRRSGIEILDMHPARQGLRVKVVNRKTEEVVAVHDVISYVDVNYWHIYSDEPVKQVLPCIKVNGEAIPLDVPAGHKLVTEYI
ncbi:hypothetical protein [Serratia fonticola]|uniref:hypothetical protein n=1 Tax=Serratia fonticola TaxID=47917 RepID=UPI0027FB5977|nr:hypothetical protein [Serratia fonticola]MDQ7209880.1 hypothetical protein [Serratia fonticola]HBE9079250.1 hypothetical protein [Serratia fonticola]HBE9091624.1 hypothetical protein [Serratia fonticola]HBE9151023.1 hypothetical protein [Serratia fonticola]